MEKKDNNTFFNKGNAVKRLTLALADREIFSSVEQVEADLQRCTF